MNESEKIEFKKQVTDDIYKTVTAFANTNGGILYIGIDDNGEVVPIVDVDEEYTRLTNGIRDGIVPDVTIFIKYTLEEKGIIRLDVAEGTAKPYYLKTKGIKPSGVYVRQGASSVSASSEQIRQLIKLADGDQYEEMRALEQNLSFNDCLRVFQENNVPFSEEKYGLLGLTAKEQFTNLALLLSDQCTHTVKVAVFADSQNTVFRARKEFSGSVLKQAEKVFEYLQLNNQNHSEIDGLIRKDFWDYPQEAVREALLNALIHRDYSFSGSFIININDKCMEFISIGGLLPGLCLQDIKNGVSQLRNRNLAEIFHRLNLIEAYGTGIRRIFTHYENCKIKPTITVTPNSFKLTLPNMNSQSKKQLKPNKQTQTILEYITENGGATEKEIQELLGVKKTRAFNLARELVKAQFIETVGRGENKKYVLG